MSRDLPYSAHYHSEHIVSSILKNVCIPSLDVIKIKKKIIHNNPIHVLWIDIDVNTPNFLSVVASGFLTFSIINLSIGSHYSKYF